MTKARLLSLYLSAMHQALMFQSVKHFYEASVQSYWDVSMKSGNHRNVRAITLRCQEARSYWEGDDIILGKSRPPLEKLSHLKVQYCLKKGWTIQEQYCLEGCTIKDMISKLHKFEQLQIPLSTIWPVWPLRIKAICLNTHQLLINPCS